MRILDTIQGMRQACTAARSASANPHLGLVPTMGALHQGHLTLMRSARRHCGVVAVSIFVNPTQFGPSEDFDRYPRTLEADCALLEQEGVDLLFAPAPAEMYPNGLNTTLVDVPEIASRLDGRARPGHFQGVATVVTKLFHIVSPDLAFFGQKDAAQVAVLRAMVRDLNFPLQIVVCPTVRESDGLALSSRNRYLQPAERMQALALPRTLEALQHTAAAGTHDVAALQSTLHKLLAASPGLELEYAEIVDPDTLLPIADVCQGALMAVAAKVGATRLIDNILLGPTSRSGA